MVQKRMINLASLVFYLHTNYVGRWDGKPQSLQAKTNKNSKGNIMFQNFSIQQLDQFYAQLREMQQIGITAGTPLHHLYTMTRVFDRKENPQNTAHEILKNPTPGEYEDITRAVAACLLMKTWAQELEDLNQQLTDTELATKFLTADLSDWEKETIAGILLDRHEEQAGEDAHDVLIEQNDDPADFIAQKFTQAA